jgi:hypothetical protein
VTAIGATEGVTNALVDVSDPRQSKVKEVLWRKSRGPDVKPFCPIYSATTRRCIFAGSDAKGMALYSVTQGDAGPAKPLAPEVRHQWIGDLAYSPDGRYILFSGGATGR